MLHARHFAETLMMMDAISARRMPMLSLRDLSAIMAIISTLIGVPRALIHYASHARMVSAISANLTQGLTSPAVSVKRASSKETDSVACSNDLCQACTIEGCTQCVTNASNLSDCKCNSGVL